MSDDDSTAQQIAYSAMAQGTLDRLEFYLDRGRQLQGIGHDDLVKHWLRSTRALADDPFTPATDMDDGTSEFELRKIEPPYDLAKDGIDRAISKVSKSYENMTEEQRERSNERLLEDHEKNSRLRQ